MSKKEKICLGIILLAAFAIRVIKTLKVGDFCWDEFFSVTFSQKSWGDSWRYWLMETNGPAHMIVLKIWFWFFPINHFFARLPSIIFGTLSVLFFYKFLKKNFSEKAAVLGATLLGLNVLQIASSALARGYSLLTLLSIISIIIFYDVFINQTKKDSPWLPLINFLGIMTQLTFAILIISQLTYLANSNIKILKQYIKKHLPLGIVATIWYTTSFILKHSVKNWGSAWFLNTGQKNIGVFASLFDMLGLFSRPTSSLIVLFLMVLGSFLIIKNYLKNHELEKLNKFYFLIIFWALTMFFTILTGIENIKFYIICLPAFSAILAINISELKVNKYLLTAFTIALCLPALYYYLNDEPISHWSEMSQYIDSTNTKNNKRLLVLTDFYDLLRIKQYVGEDIGIKAFRITDENQDQINKRIILENYLYYPHSSQEIDDWLKKENLPGNYTDLFIIQSSLTMGGIDLTGRLESMGFKQFETWNLDNLSNKLYWYENTTTSKK